jgi:hypothetical protein
MMTAMAMMTVHHSAAALSPQSLARSALSTAPQTTRGVVACGEACIRSMAHRHIAVCLPACLLTSFSVEYHAFAWGLFESTVLKAALPSQQVYGGLSGPHTSNGLPRAK